MKKSLFVVAIAVLVVLGLAWQLKGGMSLERQMPVGPMTSENSSTESLTRASSGTAPSISAVVSSTNAISSRSLAADQLEQTSNWLTYRNSRDGYSFKYPPEWSLTVATPDWAESLTAASSSEPSAPTLEGIQLYAEGGADYFSSEVGFLKSARQFVFGLCFGGEGQEYSYTDEVESETTSTNLNGVFYDKLYFRVFADGAYAGISGPLYGFDISHSRSNAANFVHAAIPGSDTFDACFVASSSRPESPMIHTFIESISL